MPNLSLAPLYFLAGYVLFRLLSLLTVRDKATRQAWDARVGLTLLAALVLWKIAPLWVRWHEVFDNPLLLLYMNGGFAALFGASVLGFTVLAISLWHVRKVHPIGRWRLLAPLAAGGALAVALFAAEPLWSPPGTAPEAAVQTLMTSLDGKPKAIVEARGKVLVLNFWGTWCPPCKAELPEFQDYVKRRGDELALWSVNLLPTEAGGLASVAAYVADHHMTWTQLVDENGEVQKAFGVTAVPTTLVFDKAGKLVERRIGAVDVSWLLGLQARYGR